MYLIFKAGVFVSSQVLPLDYLEKYPNNCIVTFLSCWGQWIMNGLLAVECHSVDRLPSGIPLNWEGMEEKGDKQSGGRCGIISLVAWRLYFIFLNHVKQVEKQEIGKKKSPLGSQESVHPNSQCLHIRCVSLVCLLVFYIHSCNILITGFPAHYRWE